MGKVQDRTGDVYGRLTVLRFAGQDKHGVSLWWCRCACGTEEIANSMAMRCGGKRSCGCLQKENLLSGREALHQKSRTHGKSKTREHHIWQNMIYRCETTTCRQYATYGGRGIAVCKRWRESFAAFLEDMGPAPSILHTVDRIDNNGPYSPENCRWATRKQQALNRSSNRLITAGELTMTLSEWSERSGIHEATIHGRLRRGWPPEKAVGVS